MKIVKICSIVIITSAINSHVVNADQSGWKIIGKDLEGGYRSNETMNYYQLLAGFEHGTRRSGKLEETGDNYSYTSLRGNVTVTPIEKNSSTSSADPLNPKRVGVFGVCNKDKITDIETCYLDISNGPPSYIGLRQAIDDNGYIELSCIMGHDFPNRSGAIRIDKNPAFKTDGEGCLYGDEAKLLQDQLIIGKQLIIRYVEWPYDFPRDEEMLIFGSFSTALELYKWSHQADLETLFKQP